jgi:hypothetical protein
MKTHPSEAEDRVQRAVLGLLLDEHPVQLSVDEVVREMTGRPDDFAEHDLVETAVRSLVRAGLVHRHGPFVFPTHAAVRSKELQI